MWGPIKSVKVVNETQTPHCCRKVGAKVGSFSGGNTIGYNGGGWEGPTLGIFIGENVATPLGTKVGALSCCNTKGEKALGERESTRETECDSTSVTRDIGDVEGADVVELETSCGRCWWKNKGPPKSGSVFW